MLKKKHTFKNILFCFQKAIQQISIFDQSKNAELGIRDLKGEKNQRNG